MVHTHLLIWRHPHRPSSLDVQFVDYDGVRFHLSTPERKTALLLSMHIRCWAELVQFGANDVLQREYGFLLKAQAEPEYNVSLEIDLEQIPSDIGKLFLRVHNCTPYWVSLRGAGGLY